MKLDFFALGLISILAFNPKISLAQSTNISTGDAVKSAEAATSSANEAARAADEASALAEAVVAEEQAMKSNELSVEKWPTASDFKSTKWLPQILFLDMPQGASFQLLAADSEFPPCHIGSGAPGGAAVLLRNGQDSEYGCWWAIQRENDNSIWVNLRMKSGIEFTLPMNAFNKRTRRP